MATPIIMPKFGQMTEESTIQEWLKKEGDVIAKGDTLFTVETDKSVMEVESFAEGTLIKIAVKAGVSVPVQSVVGFLGTPGEAIPDVTPPVVPVSKSTAPAAPLSAAKVVEPARPVAPTANTPVAAATPFGAAPAVKRVSPRAAALARRSAIDPAPIMGTGPNGRVVEKDVAAYLEAKGYANLRVTAAAKALAVENKIDLLAISTADGRIGVADVERAMAERPVAMSKMRQIIAQRLSQSVITAPHFFVTVEVDMSDLIALRAKLKANGATYSITDFISQAAVLTLLDIPQVNSSTDGLSTRWNSHVHLGLAVSLDQGLVVPVVRNAEELTLAELSAQSKALFDKARSGRLAPDEMSGSTFTISNMGMLDVENFTAIINPGESAILAVSSTIEKPVVRSGQIVIRPIMKMTLSSDHRLIDGALAAKFVNALKKRIEDIEQWRTLTSS